MLFNADPSGLANNSRDEDKQCLRQRLLVNSFCVGFVPIVHFSGVHGNVHSLVLISRILRNLAQLDFNVSAMMHLTNEQLVEKVSQDKAAIGYLPATINYQKLRAVAILRDRQIEMLNP